MSHEQKVEKITDEDLLKGALNEESLGSVVADHHGKGKEKVKGQKEKVEEKIKEEKFKKNDVVVSAPEKDKESKETEENQKEKPKKVKQGKAKERSKNYLAAKALIDPAKKYELEEAIELVKKTSLTSFDGNIEVHVRVIGKSGKPEILRGFVQYPNSTGKKTKIVILDEKIIEDIIKTGKIDADIYLTKPALMPQVAKLAKILGPKGKMPNPKSGTITENPEKTLKELSGGQVEYKSDNTGNIHQVIGKISFENKKLIDNYQALLPLLPKEKIIAVNLCATMGPAVKVQN